MSKPKVKLNAEQKQRLENLEWFAKNKVSYHGEDSAFKEVVEVGKYAVFSTRGEEEGYDSVLGATDLHTVECMLKYNCSAHYLVVELDHLMVLQEVKRSMRPVFSNYVEMLDAKELLKDRK